MWNSKIKVGNREVIDSGCVTAFGDELIEISLSAGLDFDDARENELTFVFEFRDDGNEPRTETNDIDDMTVKHILYNYRSGGATVGAVSPRIGPVEPLLVGEVSGHQLLLNYQVSGRGVTDSEAHASDFYYTFYKGKEVEQPLDD